MINISMKSLGISLRTQFFQLLEKDAHDEETFHWSGRLMLRLFYAVIFFLVLERTYFWFADKALTAMMITGPLDRSEQFTLSLLIHYPQFFLLSIIAALLALWLLNSLVFVWCCLARVIYRRHVRSVAVATETGKPEVPNE
ncbi:MAG: hypothetical protein E7I22_05015 [Bifidobacterium longum]|nr:hypothetical protein [Bifidobacterium longum]